MPTILGLNTEELRALLEREGVPAYRGNQLGEWLYRRGARTFDEMNNLPIGLRSQLKSQYEVGRSRVVTAQYSHDGTIKLLLEMAGEAKVETVGLPYAERLSCCLSTQVGCPIGCVFCATGRSGYTRDLTAGEMVDQVLTVQEAMRSRLSPENTNGGSIDHVTFMGMGEPLLNYAATLQAIRLLNTEVGIAMRHLTVSTVGLVPGIYKLAREKLQITLAVSLHAPNDELRRRLIPKMARFKVAEIIEACHFYIKHTSRRVTFEYCLLGGINDGAAEARELVRLLHGLNCHVNIIPYNQVPGLDFREPAPKETADFVNILSGAGIPVTRRVQRGPDIAAACGQLRQGNRENPVREQT